MTKEGPVFPEDFEPGQRRDWSSREQRERPRFSLLGLEGTPVFLELREHVADSPGSAGGRRRFEGSHVLGLRADIVPVVARIAFAEGRGAGTGVVCFALLIGRAIKIRQTGDAGVEVGIAARRSWILAVPIAEALHAEIEDAVGAHWVQTIRVALAKRGAGADPQAGLPPGTVAVRQTGNALEFILTEWFLRAFAVVAGPAFSALTRRLVAVGVGWVRAVFVFAAKEVAGPILTRSCLAPAVCVDDALIAIAKIAGRIAEGALPLIDAILVFVAENAGLPDRVADHGSGALFVGFAGSFAFLLLLVAALLDPFSSARFVA